ncbi:hypothetical protein ZIOFF_052229 [Zingiber officinale]|uniref:Uncharacterized protein n=1 Tax=Zingiber officinale TaxID=94328 RepID=A0A8J5FLS0_ZINOF|nr:hypothetical protein ZIOFF_052229 [Zingiber officinale]
MEIMEAESAWEEELFLDELDIGGVLLIDDERLGSVIRSLEAEISAAAVLGADEDSVAEQCSNMHDSGRCEDCRMEDILTGGGSRSTTTACLVEEDQAEWDAAATGDQSPCGGEMGGWYVDELLEMGGVIWCEGRTGCSASHHNGGGEWEWETCAEPYYCSLWE